MKSADYSQIKSIEELRIARCKNEQRLAQAKECLKSNLNSVKTSLRLTIIFAKIVGRSFSMASDLYFYRKGILLLGSLLQIIREKRREKSTEE